MINTGNQKQDANSPFAQEVQSNVAKLLSKENISIHRSFQYKTASFDIQNRELRMPIFKDVPRDVYDLFIGHEIGHALWTRMEDFESFVSKFNNKFLYNVLEDIRIEKLSQSTYPGLIQCFKRGYTHLFENKFFGDNTQEYIDGLNLLDRINLVAKLGKSRVNPRFSEEEVILLEEALKIKTHDDVVRVAKLILDHMSSIEDPEQNNQDSESEGSSKSKLDSNGEDGDGIESNEQTFDDGEESFSNQDESQDSDSSQNDDDDTTDTETESESKNQGSSAGMESSNNSTSRTEENEEYPEIESETEKEFEKNFEKMVYDEEDASIDKIIDFQFKSPTIAQVEKCVTSYKDLFKMRDGCNRYRHLTEIVNNDQSSVHGEYQKFLKSSKKTVAILRSEFEQKKAAYEYSRARVSKRGTINVNALHKYKYSEDIFASVTNLAQAKSHGIVFLMDYSGSMYDVLRPILRKLLILTDFCRSLSIPFEVYAFTTSNSWVDSMNSRDNVEQDQLILADTKILQMLSSDMSKAEYKRAHQDLFWQSINPTRPISEFEQLGGTPLLEALVISHYLMKIFKEKHSIQVANLMVLSDGEGQSLVFNRTIDYFSAKGKAYGRLFDGKWFSLELSRDRMARGYIRSYFSNMESILKNLKDSYNINTICYYVASSTSKVKDKAYEMAATMYETWSEQETFRTKIQENVKKSGVCQIPNVFGYDKYILMHDGNSKRRRHSEVDKAEDVDSFDEVEVSEAHTDKDIEKMFVKFNKGNKAVKIFAKEFIETISKNF